MSEETQELPKKGRAPAILTYEEVAKIHLAIQSVANGVERLDEKLDDVGRQHSDHETRIRALELVSAGSRGATGFATWVGPVLISFAMLVLGVLTYFKP